MHKLTRKTTTGDNDIDTNPPLMGDTTAYQPSTGYPGDAEEGAGFNPGDGSVQQHQGDVQLNLLYRDGHVDGNRPDRTRISGRRRLFLPLRPLLGILIPGTAYA